MAAKKSRKRRKSAKRKSSRKTSSHRKARRSTKRKAARRGGKGHIPLPILEKRAGRLVRLVQKRGGRVK